MFNIFNNNCNRKPKECDLVQQLQQTQAELKSLKASMNLQITSPKYQKEIGKAFVPYWNLANIGEWFYEICYGKTDPILTLPSADFRNGIPRKDTFARNSGGQDMLRGLAKWLNELADIKDKYKETQERIKEL